MFKKLSSAYIVSIAKPMVEDWLQIASELPNGVISDVTPDKIIIYINPYINIEVASFSFKYDESNGFVYCFKINPHWAYMTPIDTIRNVIGHEVAHYVSFKIDLATIGVEETIKKFNLSLEENGDGGHNNQFENICKTLGVDEGFSGEYYTRTKKEKMLLSVKKFLLTRATSLVCDDEYEKYVKRNNI